MDSTENCGVCGKPLIYSTEEVAARCDVCGLDFPALIVCPEGHYVCDACHSRRALETLKDILDNTTGGDPVELMETILSHPDIPMHGPEHHAILPAVIVAAVQNAGYEVPKDGVSKAIQRGAKLPGGWCGSYGACGGGVGVGIAVSVLTEATPLTGRERGLANAATAYALGEIVDDGPRCCKRMLRKGLEAAVAFLREEMNITLVTSQPKPCRFVARNTECVREQCPYFGVRRARTRR
jgi:hypothetical protein